MKSLLISTLSFLFVTAALAAPVTPVIESAKPVTAVVPPKGHISLYKKDGKLYTCPESFGLYITKLEPKDSGLGLPKQLVYVLPGSVGPSGVISETFDTIYEIACLKVVAQ